MDLKTLKKKMAWLKVYHVSEGYTIVTKHALSVGDNNDILAIVYDDFPGHAEFTNRGGLTVAYKDLMDFAKTPVEERGYEK